MIIYGFSLSPFVRKVLVFGQEKGLELELRQISFAEPSAEFIEASPFNKMPALRDGDFTLPDSSAIIHYLDASKPDPELIPVAPRSRGRAIWYEEFADTMLTAAGARCFFNRIVAPLLGQEGDLAVAEKAEKEELPPLFDFIEKQIPESLHLVDDRLTLADIAVASPFVNFLHLGIKLDSTRHPRLQAYVEYILGRPSFSSWIENEVKFLQMSRR